MSPTKRTPKPPPDPTKLAREEAGSYRSGDGRFFVRQDPGGKWYVTDSEQTNELGLELVIGPFTTIAEGRSAVATQREQPAGASPGAKVRSLVASDRKRAKLTGLRKSDDAEPRPKAEPEPEPRPESEPKPEPPTIDYRPAPRRPTGDERDAVAVALRRINDAWTSGQPKEMRDFLDPDVVFVLPGFSGRSEGRDAAITGYEEFATSAVIHAYAESDLTIDLSRHTAVVSYRFEIDYEMNGKRLAETGRDLFVFDRSGTRWRAVWRLLLPDSPSDDG